MRKIRIGNDIAVQWSLVAKGTGEPFVVEGKDIRLSLKSIFATQEIEDFTAHGNTIAWTFKGAEQKQTGIYSLVVSVVDAQGAMVTTDVCQFVELVACSCEADGADEAGVHTESIDLVSNVEIGGVPITPDWNASEGEEGFIKNRTHYLDCDSYTPIDVESGDDDTGYMRHTYRFVASPWSDETKVAVKVEIYNPTYEADDYIKYVILNTDDYISGEGEDIISFKVGFTEFYGTQDGNEITLWTLTGNTDEIPNLSFAYIYDRQYKQLDEVFIPSNIARKSDVKKVAFNLGEVGSQAAFALENVLKHDEQITELSEDTDSRFSGQILELGAWDGYGEDIENESVARSNYIPVKKGDVIKGYIYRIALFNQNFDNIGDVYPNGNELSENIINIDDCSFIRIIVRLDFINKPLLINNRNAVDYKTNKFFWEFYSKERKTINEKISAIDESIGEVNNKVFKIESDIPYQNLIDEKTILQGYYIDASTGKVLGNGTNASFSITPYILIKANTTYHCQYVWAGDGFKAFYDLDGNFLSQTDAKFIATDAGNYKLNIIGGSSDILARLSVLREYESQAYISQYYDERRTHTPDFSLESPSLVAEVEALKEQTKDLNFNINLLDKEQLVKKAYVNASTGEVVSNNSTTFNATPFIKLEPNSIYHTYGIYTQGLLAFFDSKRIKQDASILGVSLVQDNDNNVYHAHIFTGHETTYVRGSVENGYVDDCYISKVVDAFYPYGSNSELYNFLISNSMKLRNYKILVIGDSISSDVYGNYNKWVTILKQNAFFPYNTNNSSQHATGYVATNEGQFSNFIQRLEQEKDKDSYDLVLIFGGVNDFIQKIPMGESGDDRTEYFRPAVEYMFRYLIENYTNARIGIITPLKSLNTGVNSQGLYLTDYVDCIVEEAKKYCFPILNLTDNSGFCPFVAAFRDRWTLTEYIGGDGKTGDGLHPNAEYESKYLAPMIQSFVSTLL